MQDLRRHLCDFAYEAVHQCLLMRGHGGYDVGLMEQRLRDVLGFQIGDGTA
jgi:cyclohexanecarboxyl-CoA dehydrogenase